MFCLDKIIAVTLMIRGLKYLSYEERLERAGAVQPKEEKAPGGPHCGFLVLKGGL